MGHERHEGGLSLDNVLARIAPIASPWRASAPGFRRQTMTDALLGRLPRSYLDLVNRWGPGEGFIGTRYFRLYPLDEIAAANEAYGTDSWLPGHVIFGSDGCGNAFLFDLRSEPALVIEAPFIPLDIEYVSARHPDFESFLRALAAPREGAERLPLAANPETHGLEVHERHPSVLGGDPRAPDNKVLLRPPVHAEACVFFNRVFRTVRDQAGTGDRTAG